MEKVCWVLQCQEFSKVAKQCGEEQIGSIKGTSLIIIDCDDVNDNKPIFMQVSRDCFIKWKMLVLRWEVRKQSMQGKNIREENQ